MTANRSSVFYTGRSIADNKIKMSDVRVAVDNIALAIGRRRAVQIILLREEKGFSVRGRRTREAVKILSIALTRLAEIIVQIGDCTVTGAG